MSDGSFGKAPGAKFGCMSDLIRELGSIVDDAADPRDAFVGLGRALEDMFGVHKGMLALREGREARFLAVATFHNERSRRNLSLRLPLNNTLFAAVIEQGQLYTENFVALHDGSVLERQLLIDDETESFMLRPLVHDGEVIGLLGFSSVNADAFVLFEEGLFDTILTRLTAIAAAHQLTEPGPR